MREGMRDGGLWQIGPFVADQAMPGCSCFTWAIRTSSVGKLRSRDPHHCSVIGQM